MEAVAYFAEEPHSDHPQCVDPVIAEFCRGINDAMLNDEVRGKYLAPHIAALARTRGSLALSVKRAAVLADFAEKIARERPRDNMAIAYALSAAEYATKAAERVARAAYYGPKFYKSAWADITKADAISAAIGCAEYAAGAAARLSYPASDGIVWQACSDIIGELCAVIDPEGGE